MTFTGEHWLQSLDEFHRAFMDRDWGDGYPLVPPTPQRVEALLAGVDGSPDDLVCVLPPGGGQATVYKVAVNAAMAGCLPSEMPVVMASLRAIAKLKDPWARMMLMSTSANAPLLFVNGPLVRQLGINGGRGCLGPGKQNEVNIRIGRAVILSLKNIGNWYHGIMDLDTIGTPRKFNFFFAENEQESPWEPYHVSRGFAPEDSTVTVTFTGSEKDIAFQGHTSPEQLARTLVATMGGRLTPERDRPEGAFHISDFIGVDPKSTPQGGRLLMLAPPHAVPLSEGGFTKEKFTNFVFEHLRESISTIREPHYRHYEDGKVFPASRWLFELSEAEASTRTLPVLASPDNFHVVVAGSVRAKDLVMTIAPNPVTELITRTPGGQ
jgi:hypothetical protein